MGLNEFIKYCEKNQNCKNNPDESEVHGNIIRSISKNPSLINITDIKKSYVDVGFDKYQMTIEIVLLSELGDVYICEAAGRRTKSTQYSSRKTLESAFGFIVQEFGIVPKMFRVYKNEAGIIEKSNVSLSPQDISLLIRT